MTFEEYLKSKKIDPNQFQAGEPKQWAEWFEEFEEMHPDSFTAQKLYLINKIRRKYRLKDVPSEEATPKPTTPRVIIKPKPKIG